jgi:hypothetical protein
MPPFMKNKDSLITYITGDDAQTYHFKNSTIPTNQSSLLATSSMTPNAHILSPMKKKNSQAYRLS